MDNDSKYKINGSETLDKVREGFGFCEVWTDDKGQKLFVPVTVGEVRVTIDDLQPGDDTNKPLLHHLVAACWSEAAGYYSLEYNITKKEYLDFINTHKKDEGRLKLLLKYTKKELQIRKRAKGKHIDVRMSDELYDQICRDADATQAVGLSPSACREEASKESSF